MEDLFSELNQAALEYMAGKIETAKAERAEAQEEGREPNPAFVFGLSTTHIPADLFAWMREYDTNLTSPRLALNREAILHAVAEVLSRRGIH